MAKLALPRKHYKVETAKQPTKVVKLLKAIENDVEFKMGKK